MALEGLYFKNDSKNSKKIKEENRMDLKDAERRIRMSHDGLIDTSLCIVFFSALFGIIGLVSAQIPLEMMNGGLAFLIILGSASVALVPFAITCYIIDTITNYRIKKVRRQYDTI